MTASLPPLREIIKKHGLRTKQSLGQNFLLDSQLTDKIVRLSPIQPGTEIIEIGPGPGGLTRSILKHANVKKLRVIEMDPRCYPVIEELKTYFPNRLELIEGDALTKNIEQIGEAPRALIANLPYNISTPILLKLLRHSEHYKFFTLMFQKEVGERICASPNTKAYGRLSVMAQWRTKVKIRMDVSRKAFVPAPKVTSTIVELIPHPLSEMSGDWDRMEKTVKAAFAQRRKMLRTALKPLWGARTIAMIESCNIDPQARAESLCINDFVALSLKS